MSWQSTASNLLHCRHGGGETHAMPPPLPVVSAAATASLRPRRNFTHNPYFPVLTATTTSSNADTESSQRWAGSCAGRGSWKSPDAYQRVPSQQQYHVVAPFAIDNDDDPFTSSSASSSSADLVVWPTPSSCCGDSDSCGISQTTPPPPCRSSRHHPDDPTAAVAPTPPSPPATPRLMSSSSRGTPSMVKMPKMNHSSFAIWTTPPLKKARASDDDWIVPPPSNNGNQHQQQLPSPPPSPLRLFFFCVQFKRRSQLMVYTEILPQGTPVVVSGDRGVDFGTILSQVHDELTVTAEEEPVRHQHPEAEQDETDVNNGASGADHRRLRRLASDPDNWILRPAHPAEVEYYNGPHQEFEAGVLQLLNTLTNDVVDTDVEKMIFLDVAAQLDRKKITIFYQEAQQFARKVGPAATAEPSVRFSPLSHYLFRFYAARVWFERLPVHFRNGKPIDPRPIRPSAAVPPKTTTHAKSSTTELPPAAPLPRSKRGASLHQSVERGTNAVAVQTEVQKNSVLAR